MKSLSLRTAVSALVCFAIFPSKPIAAFAADPSAAPPFITELTTDYMNGNFDAVEALLKTHAKETQAITPAQRVDITIISTAVNESRQSWWKLAKAGKKFAFHATVWNRRMDADYLPSSNGVQFNDVDGNIHFNIGWDPADMESSARGEHGFTKGEIAELGIWMDMGNADAWSMIPISSLQDTSEENRNNLVRFQDFRCCVTGAYYGTPRSRRWGLFLCLNTYLPKYSKTKTQMAREAVGAAFLHELLANPAKYSSIKLPASLPDEHIEEALAGDVKSWIERHSWTLAEDQSIREMLKRFATTNAGSTFKSATVTLPDKLLVAFDPEKDKPLALKRDAWITSHLPKE